MPFDKSHAVRQVRSGSAGASPRLQPGHYSRAPEIYPACADSPLMLATDSSPGKWHATQ
jgi:hypothetical protein